MAESLELEKAQSQAVDELAWATAVEIQDPEQWKRARERRAGLKKLDAKAERFFKDLKQPHDLAKKAILDKEKEVRGPIESAIATLDEKILPYEEAFFRERALLQRQMQEQARQRAMDERLAQAAELEKDGEDAAARALLDSPLYIPPIVLPEYGDWVAGESRQEYWEAEVIDFMALVKAVASGKQPINVLLPAMPLLNTMARALKETLDIPGVRARKRTGIVQR